jgi:undecaprenyl pyrophosphate synthase|tara:strand:+ start:767 stop:967 length:201 start_codon:yes stop_codon:yes gene_type:complete
MLLDALTKKLEGDIAVARANIDTYINNSVGIGEHSDIIGAIEGELEKLAAADEKIKAIENYLLTYE